MYIRHWNNLSCSTRCMWLLDIRSLRTALFHRWNFYIMWYMRNIAMRDYRENMTTEQTHGQTGGGINMLDKVIPVCRYASKVTQNRRSIFSLFPSSNRANIQRWSVLSDFFMLRRVNLVDIGNPYQPIFMPPDRMIGGILFLSCLSVCLFVCLFVCLLSTLTFAITFEPLEVETSYLACTLY